MLPSLNIHNSLVQMIPFRYVPIIVWYRWILCWISRDRNTSKNPQLTEVSNVVHYRVLERLKFHSRANKHENLNAQLNSNNDSIPFFSNPNYIMVQMNCFFNFSLSSLLSAYRRSIHSRARDSFLFSFFLECRISNLITRKFQEIIPDHCRSSYRDFDRIQNSTLNPPPPGGFPIYYVPSSRTVSKRTPLEAPGTNFSREVFLLTDLDEGT